MTIYYFTHASHNIIHFDDPISEDSGILDCKTYCHYL